MASSALPARTSPVRHAHVDSLGRVRELRNNLTAYAAAFMALAEAIAGPLVTCDRPLGGTSVPGMHVEVILKTAACGG